MGEYSRKFFSIKNDREFKFLFRKGETCVNYAFVCYFRENKRRRNRCGIVTGKKIGNAVTRNRARRVIREAFRQVNLPLKGNYDVVFVARTKTVHKKSTDIYNVMLPMLIEAGVVKNEELRP